MGGGRRESEGGGGRDDGGTAGEAALIDGGRGQRGFRCGGHLETSEQILQRLRDPEDQLTERKPEGAGGTEFKRQIVAFANTLPPSRSGILFIGVNDDGTIKGVSNADSLQKTIRHLAENECYPAIWVDLQVLTVDETQVLAVSVPGSPRRPHFAGPAFIRRGSETIKASDSEYEQLILSRNDKRRELLELQGKTCTLIAIGKQFGEPYQMAPNYSNRKECTVEEVTAFFARFRNVGSGTLFSETLESISISYDDKNHRPMLIIQFPGQRGP